MPGPPQFPVEACCATLGRASGLSPHRPESRCCPTDFCFFRARL